jgi:hypothetical protein
MPSLTEIQHMHGALFGGNDEEDGLDIAIEKLKQLRDLSKELNDNDRRNFAARVVSLLLDETK